MFSLLLALTAQASNYPPDYVVSRKCQQKAHVEVCSLNRGFQNAVLEINYYSSGDLWPKASPISAWVSVNGNQGIYTLNAFDRGGSIVGAKYMINQLKNVQYCYQATERDTPEYAPSGTRRCPVTNQFPLLEGNATKGLTTWFYEAPPANEREFLKGSQWETQIAFVNEKGEWDSQFGNNYKFTFA